MYLVHSIREKDKVISKTIKYIGKKRPIPKEEFECMKYSFSNKDWILNDSKDELSYQDHKKMQICSSEYKKYLKTLDKTSKQKQKEKFLSEFISNSNAIEGSTLTPKDTFNYLFNNLSPKGYSKKELYMADNMLKAWIFIEKNRKKFPKNEDLCRLHEIVNRNIEEDETLGKYKSVQNYIGSIYTTSYLFVEEKMIQLIKWIKKSYSSMDDFEVAFQSHAQFETIHPYVDGNGRVGRLLLNWLLMYKDKMPLAIRSKKRLDYISALYNSQQGKIEAISKFCFKEYINQYKFLS